MSNTPATNRRALALADHHVIAIKNGKVFLPKINWFAAGKAEDASDDLTNYFRFQLDDLWNVMKKLIQVRESINRKEPFGVFIKDGLDVEKARSGAKITGDYHYGEYLVHFRIYSNNPKNNEGEGGWMYTPSGVALNPDELEHFLVNLDRAIAYSVNHGARPEDAPAVREVAYAMACELASRDDMKPVLPTQELYDKVVAKVQQAMADGVHARLLNSMAPDIRYHANEFDRAYRTTLPLIIMADFLRKTF